MKVTKGTIIRTIMMILVIINIILQHCGYDIIDLDETTVGTAVELIIEIAILIVGFWKNNSFSEKAIKADEFLKQLREDEENNEDEEGGDL